MKSAGAASPLNTQPSTISPKPRSTKINHLTLNPDHCDDSSPNPKSTMKTKEPNPQTLTGGHTIRLNSNLTALQVP